MPTLQYAQESDSGKNIWHLATPFRSFVLTSFRKFGINMSVFKVTVM